MPCREDSSWGYLSECEGQMGRRALKEARESQAGRKRKAMKARRKHMAGAVGEDEVHGHVGGDAYGEGARARTSTRL